MMQGGGSEMMRVMQMMLNHQKECWELEEGFGTSFKDELLSGAESGWGGH